MKLAFGKGFAEFVRGNRDRGEGGRGFRLVKAEAFRQFGRYQVSQRDVVDEHQQLYVLPGILRPGPHRHVIRYDGGFRFHVDAEVLAGDLDVVARPEKIIGAALVHERVVPETVRHPGSPCFAHEFDGLGLARRDICNLCGVCSLAVDHRRRVHMRGQ